MTKAETILSAGKQLAAIASGRAFRGESQKVRAEDILNDPTLEKQGEPASEPGSAAPEPTANQRAANESQADPGNPNDADHNDRQPGQTAND